MKKYLALSLSLLLYLPAMADSFDSLNVEQTQLFNKVMSGSASNTEVARFQEVTAQIKRMQEEQFNSTIQQRKMLDENMRRIQAQNESIKNSLFGGNPVNNINNIGGPVPAVSAPVSEIPDSIMSSPISSPDSSVPLSINTASASNDKRLSGNISRMSYKSDDFLDLALGKNQDYLATKAQVEYYGKPVQKFVASAKDNFNYLIPYRGFEPSAEMGRAILDEEQKVKSLGAALYKQQLIIDQAHLQIQIAVMQMAQEGGVKNGKGFVSLKSLIGEEAAIRVNQSLMDSDIDIKADIWDINTMQEKRQIIMKAAIDKDPSIQEIVDSLHGYTKKGTASKIIMPTLGAISMVPVMGIGVMARGALATYIIAAGGTNEKKMLDECYLGQRLESRMTLIAQESTLALEALQIAKAKNNPVLAAAAASLIEQMSSPEIVKQVLQ
jgi:hypothetical protein